MTYRTSQKSLTRNNSGAGSGDLFAALQPDSPLATNLVQYNRLHKPRNTIDMLK